MVNRFSWTDGQIEIERVSENGGPGSGNFGHGGRPGQVGGSAGKGGSGASSKSSKKKSVLKGMIANARKNGGMTTNVLGDSPSEGIAFAPRKDTETIIKDADFNEESLDKFVDKHWDTLKQKGMHIGGWHNTDDGNWYLDISKVGPYNKNTIKEAQDAEQLAVFDLKTFNEIKTGDIKDGKYTKSAEPETIFAEAFGRGDQGGVQNSSQETRSEEEDERVLNYKGNPNREKATGRFTFGTAAQKSKLAELEGPIRANKKETFHAVDTKGNVITTLSGNSKQVNVPFAEAMKIAASKNAILTHNHPSQGTGQNAGKTFPFSLDDLKTASMTNARGIRAVGETHDYSIARKGDTWPTPSNVTRAYNAGKKVAETKLKAMVADGKMTNAEAQFEWYHEAIKSVAEKYDLSYERREVK